MINLKRIKVKHDNWTRLANRRTDKVIENLISLRKLANLQNYHFHKNQIIELKKHIQEHVDETIKTFEIELEQLQRKENKISCNLKFKVGKQ